MKKLDMSSIHETNCQSKSSKCNSRLSTRVLIFLYITFSMCMLLSNIATWSLITKEYQGLQSKLVYLLMVVVLIAPLLIIWWIRHETNAHPDKQRITAAIYIIACNVLNTFGAVYIVFLRLSNESVFSIVGIVNIIAVAWLLISAVYAHYELSRCASVK